MVLTGGALERLKAITPPGMTARIDLTISDEPPLAQPQLAFARQQAVAEQPPVRLETSALEEIATGSCSGT